MNPTSISTTEAARHLGDFLARVKHKGEHFLLTKNDRPIAELLPASGSRRATWGEMVSAVSRLPRDPTFADDLEKVNESRSVRGKSMGLILDTSAIVAWERAHHAGQPVTVDYSEEIVLPAVVWAEALAGVRLADSASRAARRMAWLESLRRLMGVEPFTAETAEHHADIFAELHQAGTMIPQNDIAVAATARCLGCGVLVGPRDEAHFRRIAGLEVRVLGGG